MTDRYVKRVLTIIALALTALAVQSLSNGLFPAHAQTKPARHCIWTYVNDEGHPNIGHDGTVEFNKGGLWKKMSDEGWELKAIDQQNDYIFEKCE